MMKLFPKAFSGDGEGRMPWYPPEATGFGHSLRTGRTKQKLKDPHKGTSERTFILEAEKPWNVRMPPRNLFSPFRISICQNGSDRDHFRCGIVHGGRRIDYQKKIGRYLEPKSIALSREIR